MTTQKKEMTCKASILFWCRIEIMTNRFPERKDMIDDESIKMAPLASWVHNPLFEEVYFIFYYFKVWSSTNPIFIQTAMFD